MWIATPKLQGKTLKTGAKTKSLVLSKEEASFRIGDVKNGNHNNFDHGGYSLTSDSNKKSED